MQTTAASKYSIEQIFPGIIDLMLDVILEIMQAERGSVMLLDEHSQELSIQSARGLKDQIIDKVRVKLGQGISGKVASGNKPVLLKGAQGEQSLNITSEDLANPDIDTSYIVPLTLHNRVLGTVNVSSTRKDHGISTEKEEMVQSVIQRFTEYLFQIDLPVSRHNSPSQLYMMNIFREYNILRELRVVFDYIFHLTSHLLGVEEKGIFLLQNPDSGFFDLVLGYGLDVHLYQKIYEQMIPVLTNARIQSLEHMAVFEQKELSATEIDFIKNEFILILPLVWKETVRGQILMFVKEPPKLEQAETQWIETVAQNAAKIIEASTVRRRFDELTLTDNLTGTYNYGLWWKRVFEEIGRSQRLENAKLSLIVFDIDQFDRVNRNFGYLIGDEFLRLIADRIKGCVRGIDVVGRIGGEEFGVALPGAHKHDAIKVGKRILSAVSDIGIELRLDLQEPITLSGGVSCFPDDADTVPSLVEHAKTALLSAKIMGGNGIKAFNRQEE